MLEQLSMIIRIQENNHMLDDILLYHAPTGVNIYIAHDSQNPYELHGDLKKFNNINYFYMPDVNPVDRALFLLGKIKTKFCVFRGDRRHITNKSLAKSLNFLQENSDFSSASGIWIQENLCMPHMVELISKDGLHDNAYERVQYQALSYQPPYYNVYETNLAKAFFNILAQVRKKVANVYYNEFLHAFLCFFLGKTMQFKHFSGVIQEKPNIGSYRTDWHKAIYIFQDQELSAFIASTMKNHLINYGFNVSGIHEALLLFHDAMTIRFLAYRNNTYEQDGEIVKTFGDLENIYAMLNNKLQRNEKMMEYYLRAFLAKNFDVYAKFEHMQMQMKQEDMEQMDDIWQMIANIKQKSIFNDVKPN